MNISRRLSLSDIQEAFGFRLGSKNNTQPSDEIETKWRSLNEKEREQWYNQIQAMTRFERHQFICHMNKNNNVNHLQKL